MFSINTLEKKHILKCVKSFRFFFFNTKSFVLNIKPPDFNL